MKQNIWMDFLFWCKTWMDKSFDMINGIFILQRVMDKLIFCQCVKGEDYSNISLGQLIIDGKMQLFDWCLNERYRPRFIRSLIFQRFIQNFCVKSIKSVVVEESEFDLVKNEVSWQQTSFLKHFKFSFKMTQVSSLQSLPLCILNHSCKRFISFSQLSYIVWN